MVRSLRTKALGLVCLVATTAILMGACPTDSILNNNSGQPTANKPAAPTFRFTQPAARVDVEEGTVISLQWTDTHEAGAAIIQLFCDYDGVYNTRDEQTITYLTEAAATKGGTYAWNTTGLTPHVYRVGAVISDQVNSSVWYYLPYEVVIRSKTNTTPQGDTMSLDLLTPATALTSRGGTSITIHWTAVDPSHSASLYLYYDADVNPINDNKVLITVVNIGSTEIGTTDYSWTIPDGLIGSYNILGRLSNGVDPDVYAYAPGSVSITTTSAAAAQRDISSIGVTFPGYTFNGYIPYGRVGEVMAGGKDPNGSSWRFGGFSKHSDFVLVAPTARSQLLGQYAQPDGRTGVGEAYLIFSPDGRWPQNKSISLGNITSTLDGVRFIGPQFTTSSTGIQDVMFLPDVDGDGYPEIIFSTSDINGVVEDQQDYDPLDSNTIHSTTPPAPAGWTPGMYYYQCPGWQIFSDTPPNHYQDGITRPPWAPQVMESGLVAWVSSQSGSAIYDHNVLLDQVGGELIWDNQVSKLAHASGMKVFPNAGGDDSGWGAKVGSGFFFGDRKYPSVFVARPNHAGGAGSVKVMPHAQMTAITSAWTAKPTAVALFTVVPNCWTFPGADSDGNQTDADRIPQWPFDWYLFMDPLARSLPNRNLPQPSDLRYDIINSNLADAANGHMTNPTGLGDFDGDGADDMVASMPDAVNQAGLAYLLYGRNTFRGADLSKVASVTGPVVGFELRGTQSGEQLGYKMAGPGNIIHNSTDNPPADGIIRSDWVLTAPHRSWGVRNDCGAVIIVPGQPGVLGSYDVDEVVPTLNGTIIYGGAPGDELGMYVSPAGDVDQDGYQDFLVSAPGYSDQVRNRPGCGAIYLIYGGPHLQGKEFDISQIGSTDLPGKVYIGPEAGAAIGPVCGAGDTDGDGHDDFLIAQPNANAQGLTQSGRVWLIYGDVREAP